MKKVLSVILAGLMVVSLAACGGSKKAETTAAAAEKAPKTVAFVSSGDDLPTWKEMYEGVCAGLKEKGENYKCERLDPQTANDLSAQSAVIDDCITKQVDAVVINPVDEDACFDFIDRLHEAGIPCVTMQMEKKSDNAICQLTYDNYTECYNGGKYVGDVLKGGENIVLMNGIMAWDAGKERHDGFIKGVEEGGKKFNFIEAYGEFNTDTAYKALEDIINTGEKFDVVYCAWGGCVPSLVSLCKSAGLNDVKFISQDAYMENIALIEEGINLCDIARPMFASGKLAGEALGDHFNGAAVTHDQTMATQVVNKDNYKDWMKEFYPNENLDNYKS